MCVVKFAGSQPQWNERVRNSNEDKQMKSAIGIYSNKKIKFCFELKFKNNKDKSKKIRHILIIQMK